MFETLLDWSRNIISFGSAVVGFFTTRLGDTLGVIGDKLPNEIADLTMFAFLTGGGIVFILTYSLIAWVIDIFP